MKDALADALERHRLMVESVPTERAVDAAFAAAPDLVVLIGDAASDAGQAVLARLGQSPATATVPVVLLADDAALDRRLDAFRHGVVAVVPRTASADGMARRVAEVARELPERAGEATGELGEATVDELVELFSQQLRTGILSVTTGDSSQASAQVVLRAGRPVTEAIEELVERLRPLVQGQSGPLRYEFHESTSARLSLLDEESEPEDTSLLAGRRILLIEQNPARADVLVQELRAHGALVVVADGEGTGLERARALDPEVVVIDGSGVHGWALPTLRALRRDPRLRWASLLVVDGAELWPAQDRGPDLARLAASLKPLVRPARELAERAAREATFDTRLEVIGPSRMLRALTGTGLGLRVSVGHPRARVEVDLAEALVAGARALAPGKAAPIAEGPAALAALLALGSGRVRVERKDAPAAANVMAPVDDALAAAARERPPIKASVPPPASSEPPATVSSATGADAEKLVGRLEELLERLSRVLPAAEAAAKTADDTPTGRHVPVPKRPLAIPPPRAALPSAPSRRRPTLALGSLAAAPEEDEEDLPVIEGTAEPGVRTVPPVVAPIRAVGEPAAHLPAPALPSAPPTTAPAPSAPAAPWLPPPEPAVTLEPRVEVAPLAVTAPAISAPVQEPAPAVAHTPSLGSLPIAPVAFAEDEQELPIRRSRGPLWFALAFLTTLLVGGAVAAYLQFGRDPRTPPAEPAIAAEQHPPTPQPPDPPARAPVEPPATNPTQPGETTELADATDTDPPVPETIETGDTGDTDVAEATVPDEAPTATDTGEAQTDTTEADAARTDTTEPDEPGDGEAGESETEIAEAEPQGRETDAPESRSSRVVHLIRVANFERNRGNVRAAEAAYQQVLSLDRTNARALAGLVRLDLARHNPSGAVRWARRLVDAHPRNAANHVLLGDALEAVGNHRAAVRSWQHALELSPSTASARRRLAGSH